MQAKNGIFFTDIGDKAPKSFQSIATLMNM